MTQNSPLSGSTKIGTITDASSPPNANSAVAATVLFGADGKLFDDFKLQSAHTKPVSNIYLCSAAIIVPPSTDAAVEVVKAKAKAGPILAYYRVSSVSEPALGAPCTMSGSPGLRANGFPDLHRRDAVVCNPVPHGMLRAIAQSQFQTVIVENADRLSRDHTGLSGVTRSLIPPGRSSPGAWNNPRDKATQPSPAPFAQVAAVVSGQIYTRHSTVAQKRGSSARQNNKCIAFSNLITGFSAISGLNTTGPE